MKQVLIVSSSKKGGEVLAELLDSQSVKQLTVAESAAQARQCLLENFYELVIINAPLADGSGRELAVRAAETTVAGVILMVRQDGAEAAEAWAEDYGIFVVPKPINKIFFFQALKMVRAFHRRLLGLRRENTQLQQQIQDIRLTDRAKCVLIQYLDMTEAQAHKYIERQAMDLRVSKREVAQGILRTYESENN